MRILMISDVYFPRVNGVSTSIQTFATELTEKGHEITLIAPEYSPVAAGQARGWLLRKDRAAAATNPCASDLSDESDTFEIIRIPSRYLLIDPEDRILRWRKIRALYPQLAGRCYDLAHIQTPFVAHYAGLRLASRLKVPVVESYHTFFEQYLDKYVTILPSSWLRRVLPAAVRGSRSSTLYDVR